MKTLSLIIPVYNEEKTLENIVNKVLLLEKDIFFQENDIQLELILVDDCSKDESLKVANLLATNNNKIKVFSHSKNKGKGRALKTGFENANGDFIGIQDADNEYNPYDYIKMLKIMLNKEADIVYGSRYLKQDTKQVLSFYHTIMNKGLTLLTNVFTNLDITDMETCYKLFKKDIIKSIAPKLKENRFGFEPEITIYVANKKCKIYECAIDYNPRTYEEGKKIKAKDGFRALYCILFYGIKCLPLYTKTILLIFFLTLIGIFILID